MSNDDISPEEVERLKQRVAKTVARALLRDNRKHRHSRWWRNAAFLCAGFLLTFYLRQIITWQTNLILLAIDVAVAAVGAFSYWRSRQLAQQAIAETTAQARAKLDTEPFDA